MGEEWNAVLVAITSKGVDVRNVEIRFCQADRCIRFFDFEARFEDLGMGCKCPSHTRFPRAGRLCVRSVGIENQRRCEWKSYGIVEPQYSSSHKVGRASHQ
jgi:hypothetical protein